MLNPVIGIMMLLAVVNASVIQNIHSYTDQSSTEQGICESNCQVGCLRIGATENSCYSTPTASSWFLVKIQDRLVRCDPSYGGWLVFVKRQDGSEDFVRTWAEYRDGFGDVTREFWLGNEMLHQITKDRVYRLRVEIDDWDGMKYWAEYDDFQVAPPSELYRLSVGGYRDRSTAGDSLTSPDSGGRHSAHSMPFSASDLDNDNNPGGNCGEAGGWWHNNCKAAFPTGVYLGSGRQDGDCLIWRTVFGNNHCFRAMEFKIRPLESNIE